MIPRCDIPDVCNARSPLSVIKVFGWSTAVLRPLASRVASRAIRRGRVRRVSAKAVVVRRQESVVTEASDPLIAMQRHPFGCLNQQQRTRARIFGRCSETARKNFSWKIISLARRCCRMVARGLKTGRTRSSFDRQGKGG